jgi:hypothetical protein
VPNNFSSLFKITIFIDKLGFEDNQYCIYTWSKKEKKVYREPEGKQGKTYPNLQHQLHAFLKKEHLKRVMNASSIEDATEIDYFITNVKPSKVTPEWIVNTYSL